MDATALVTVTEDETRVRLQRRAHHPLLITAGLADTDVRIPWLGGRRLRRVFG